MSTQRLLPYKVGSDQWKAQVNTYHSKSFGYNLDVPESGTKTKGVKVNPKLRDAIEQACNQVANDVAALATHGEKKTVSM